MKMKIFLISKQILLGFIVFGFSIMVHSFPSSGYEACTIGVAAGKATSDGRPLIWKTTDGGGEGNRVLKYISSQKIKFICENIPSRPGAAAMGLNEKGFAILNSQSGDLEGGNSGYGNTSFMWVALGKCATLGDFEDFLDSTNVTGRRTTANFAAMDSNGSVVIYETSGNQYWKFDANDTTMAPHGYLIRANFSMNGGGANGIDRFNRSSKLIGDFYTGDSLDYKSILRYQMRDFSDWESNPIPIPYQGTWSLDKTFGYIDTENSICRLLSLSSAVIQGVLPYEPAELSTMWELLGHPAATIAAPYWPVGKTSDIVYNLPTARLCDIAKSIKTFLFDYPDDYNYIDTYKLRDEAGNGLWGTTFHAEDSILAAAEEKLQYWRTSSISVNEMLTAEEEFAQYAYSKLCAAHVQFLTFNSENVKTSKVFSSYSEIVPDSILKSGDDSQSVIDLPFLFQYDGVEYDKIQVSTNGWLEFGKGEAGSDSGLSIAAQLAYVGALKNERLASDERPSKALAPWWDDLTPGSAGEIGYKLNGFPPNRILTIQWKNILAYTSGTSTQLNFQVALYESLNDIQFRYGPIVEGTYAGDGASIGFKDLKGGSLRFYDLEVGKICYDDELVVDLNPLTDWPGPDSCIIIKTYTEPTTIGHFTHSVPKSPVLSQNYPNPFNPSTTIEYQLPATSHVDLSIYNLLGQKVSTLVTEKQNAGTYQVQWDATGLASGIYFYQLQTKSNGNSEIYSRKLMLLK